MAPCYTCRVQRSGVGVLVAALLLVGCGYRMVGAAHGLGSVESVAVRTLRNDSFQPDVEYLVGDALRREILRRGGADLSEDPDAADLVVSGRVLPLQISPRSFSSVLLALEYEVTMTLDLEVQRRDGSDLPLEESAFRESERYLSSADVEAERKNRLEALRRVSRVLATRLFDLVAEDAS
jgi:hypothetical protein